MTHEIEAHIEAITATYCPLITGEGSRLVGGASLWKQFEDAVEAYRRHGRTQVSGLVERVNELAVARKILTDSSLPRTKIHYEPEIVPHGNKFDFVVPEVGGKTLYIEVKTVAPRTEDNDQNWDKVRRRQKLLTPDNQYIVDKEWMGATILSYRRILVTAGPVRRRRYWADGSPWR